MPALEKSFDDFNFFMGGFMVKEANNPNELRLHQDWNIVDESQYTSYQIWIPLDLSYPGNGGMFVLPGSHRFYQNYRSGSYGIPDVNTDEIIRSYVVDMIIPPGQALVFHNSLFHASYPNGSPKNRISAIISIYKKEAPLTYCHKNAENNCTEIYGITPEIFLTSLNTLENGGVPEHPLSKVTVPINETNNKLITSRDLREKYKAVFGEENDFEPMQLHILRDKENQRRMNRDGYIVLDFLEKETVNLLKAEYENQFNSVNTSIGRFTPMEHSSPASKRSIHKLILDNFQDKLDEYFENYQAPIASYFTKYARSIGDLSWHHDASLMINTNLEPHYGIWCPLLDVNEQNGAFCLIEGSHKYAHAIYLEEINWPFTEYSSQFDKLKKVIALKAGQMVLFDLRLIHNATPNDTDEDRLTACMRLTHLKTKYYSFLCQNKNELTISIYEERPDYYLRDDWSGTNQVPDRSKKIGEMHNIYSNIDYRAIEEKLSRLAVPQ
jgi:ectoine hydroxylase-related dioxygenase (phytanoyl-CoA dioxygenase family)